MKRNRFGVSPFWIAAFLGALALVGAGVVLGETGQILMNAASICLACMGVG